MASKKHAFKFDKFVDHMQNFTTHSFTLVSMIFGQSLNLFQILNSGGNPISSSELADKSGCKERYIREWLGIMTAAEILELTVLEDGKKTYNLTSERYDVIMSTVMLGRHIFGFKNRFDKITACFKKSGPCGDPDAFNGEFWDLCGDFRKQSIATTVQEKIFPSIALTTDLEKLLRNGCQVIDIGCGSGLMTLEFAERYSNSSFTGVDVSEDSLVDANSYKKAEHVTNAIFKKGNSECLPDDMDESFDVVLMFETLHNLPDPCKAIRNVAKVLRNNGKFVLHEYVARSNPIDNVCDMLAARHLTFSLFYCFPFSMSNQPHSGYGVGWGEDEVMKAVTHHFTFDAKYDLQDLQNLFVFTKKIKNI